MHFTDKNSLVAGVDEAGRGPLAGPVIAAAVVFDRKKPLQLQLTDSKLLSPKKREELFPLIIEAAVAWAIGRAETEEIDKLNIHHANLLAMKRAVEALSKKPREILVDGKFCPSLDFPCDIKSVIGGDILVPVISAASILAKVWRDREMVEIDKQFPQYGFAIHKGYGTKRHLEALKKFGPCPLHRFSFAPIKGFVKFVSRGKPRDISYGDSQGEKR